MVSDRQVWMHITALGDSSVTLPCISLIALWLLLSASKRGLAWRWLLLVVGVMALIATSKLAFMVWGIGSPRLDFTGLSGHAAMSALVWPALLGLLAGRGGNAWRGCAVALGALLAAAVAWSRVVLHAHSVSEVLLGYALGAAFALVLLWRHGREWRLAWSPLLAMLPLLLVLPFVYGRHFPSQDILKTIATHIAHGPLHTRQELHHSP
jgi:membrane-associated phospholipid phosphatase